MPNQTTLPIFSHCALCSGHTSSPAILGSNYYTLPLPWESFPRYPCNPRSLAYSQPALRRPCSARSGPQVGGLPPQNHTSSISACQAALSPALPDVALSKQEESFLGGDLYLFTEPYQHQKRPGTWYPINLNLKATGLKNLCFLEGTVKGRAK